MAEHLSDQEEIDALKRWWKESGRQTLAMVVIAVAGYFGWNAWQENQQHKAETASVIYQEMLETAKVSPGVPLNDEQHAQITHLAVSLKEQHAGSQYAHYAAMMLAKLAVEKDDLDTAAAQLETVVENASEGISLVARLRLAKVQAAREKFDEALSLLEAVDARTLASAYAEARGDFYLLQGKNELAYTAYQQAIASMSEIDSRTLPLLELKINQVLPAEQAAAETEAVDIEAVETSTTQGDT